MKQRILTLVFTSIIVVSGMAAVAEDWPTYMHDAQRSGITSMNLALPLNLAWTHVPIQPPEPAWPEPAKQDYWNEVRELSPVVIYDRAFHVTVAGDALFYGSSANDQVYCLDIATGAIRWRFFTEGPVRLAPSVYEGRVYFGSDDGYTYCVQADNGALLWKFAPGDLDRRIPGNSRIISQEPARTGVIVDNGVAYFFSGLFTPKQVYKCALNAATGEVLQCDTAPGVSPQGYLLASSTRLFVPTGRTAPFMFERDTLENLGAVQGPGGAYALLVEDAVVSGPGVRAVNTLQYASQDTKESIASFPGTRMLVRGNIAYLQSPGEASALDRPRYLHLSMEINKRNESSENLRKQLRELDRSNRDKKKGIEAEIGILADEIKALEEEREACYLWKKPATDPYAMILVGDTLFMGGQDRIYAMNASDGEEVWHADVEGRIYGLAAANGRLYASSNTGRIYCFDTMPESAATVAFEPANDTPYPADSNEALYAGAAKSIIDRSGISKGYCIVLDAGEGRLAYELARNSDLFVVGVEQDAARVAAARNVLAGTGLYGRRIVIHHIENNTLPYTGYLANLVVSEEALLNGVFPWSAEEVYRILRPYGGRAYLPVDGMDAQVYEHLRAYAVQDGDTCREDGEWFVMERGAVAGAGEWTQLYADASHTACSGDKLEGPTTIQWFGEPGPREMVDRHHRPMSALFQKGRLFITADNKVIAADGYNGTKLWELEVPDSRRVGSMKNSGHQLLADDLLYVVRKNECWTVDTATGEQKSIIQAPQHGTGDKDWGYLNAAGNLLIGSGQAQGASFDVLDKSTVNMLEGDYRPVVMSEYLFAINRATGEQQWMYDNGRFLNAMITVEGERLFCLVSRNAKTSENTDGHIRINDFMEEDAFLVALDVNTGTVLWEHSVTLPYDHIAYLNCAKGILVASGSYNENLRLYYDMYGFDTDSGATLWQKKIPGMNIRGTDLSDLGGSHGEQWQHPVIMGDTIYLRPFAFALETGEQKEYINYRGGHGCGGLTGSEYYLFGRGNNPRIYPTDVESTEGIPLTEVSRPGCFLNIIPAGGIIMIPESSSGCTCAYPLQTSLALLPESMAGGVKR
jgi:outer membrane protein assembly factor BamB